MSFNQEENSNEYEEYLRKLVMKAKLRRRVSSYVCCNFGPDIHSIIMKYYS